MTPSEVPESQPSCGTRRAVVGAASLTFVVTVLRLFLELGHAPAWLASRDAGGRFAVLGISWLPLVFGPIFAARIAPHATTTWSFIKRMYKTLVVYGWSARVPVVLITLLALYQGWDVHFTNFGPRTATISMAAKVGVTLGAQLIFWSMIWTPISGTLAGLVYRKFTRSSEAGPMDAAARPMRAS